MRIFHLLGFIALVGLVPYRSIADETQAATILDVGPFVWTRLNGVNVATIPEGRQTGFHFNTIPDIGVQAQVRFPGSANMAGGLALGYRTYTVSTIYLKGAEGIVPELPELPRRIYDQRTSSYLQGRYFCVTPTFSAGLFTTGFTFGFPLSGTYFQQRALVRQTGVDTVSAFIGEIEADVSDILASPLFEWYLGIHLPLYEHEGGRLLFTSTLGYTFTGMLSEQPRWEQSSTNPRPVSLQIGLSYLFGFKL